MPETRNKPVSNYSLQFARNTKKLMEIRSLSYDRLADIVGISKGNVYRVVNGQSEVSLRVVEAITRYFDKSCSEMIESDIKV